MTVARKTHSSDGEAHSGRLVERLDRLATDQRRLAAERQALPAGAPARVRALVTEIDETVLPRIYVVTSDTAGEVGRMVVSQRRLVDVIVPGRDPASAEPDNLARRAAARLLAIADRPGTLSISVTRRDTPPGHAEEACSVAALERALGLGTPQGALTRLEQRIEPLALAQLTWTDDPAAGAFAGDEDWEIVLEIYAGHRVEAAARARKGRIGRSCAEGMAIPLSDGLVMVVAVYEKQGIAAVLPRAAGLNAVADWQRG